MTAPPVTGAGQRITARYPIDPADPVFPGHYPGFPVLPGLYLLEFVREAVRSGTGLATAVRVDEVRRCRFLGPVYPGDEIAIEATLTPLDSGSGDAPPAGDRPSGRRWHCAAEVRTGAGRAAELRLLLAEEIGEVAA